LPVISERANICNYLDMPLQHATTDMLKYMRRGISGERTVNLLKDIRQQVPNIALRTTLIAGHPGETEADFDALCRFVEDTRFERLGVFTYSHEENTHAHTMPDVISAEVKQYRADTLMEIQEKISYDLNQKKIGQTFKVLFDRKEGGQYVGRTEFDSPEVDNEVLVDATDQYVRIGDFAQVHIHDATEFDLYGEVVV